MKTFTTYAEKKAKQFFYLLQRYTKSIRITAMLMLLVVGTSNAWGQTVLFFQDNIGMSGRYAYFYSSSYWNESNGAGSKNIASQCNSMTKLGNNGTADIYVYQHSTTRKYVAVMQDSQSSYDNFWQTQGCAATYDACDGLYDIKNPMMIPNKGSSWKKNNDQTTYYNFSWGIPTVWIKHPFGGGDWTFKQMTYNNDGTFSLDAEYSNGNGCNYGCNNNDAYGWIASPTKTPNNTWSHLARFKMTFNGGSINMSITKLCVVTFDMNDHGSAIDSQNILYNNNATQPSNPTATGYTFGGWYKDANCTDAFNFSTAITDDITLYAKWTANENFFNVTAVANPTAGGTVTPTTATSMGQNTGDDITATAKTGYTFNNWTIKSGSGYFGTSGTNITSTTANTKFRPTATSTVQANFTENLTTITITASPTAGGTLTVDGNTFASGNTVTAGVTTSHSVVANANVGYEFNKWTQGGNSSASRSGNSVTLKGNGNSGTGTLTAHFAPIEYSITYKDQGGGDFSGTHASGYPTTHTYGTATTLKTATKTGYTFEGWFTNSNCTGTAVTSLGATAYTSNITLYAKWTAVPTTIYLKPSATWKYADARFAIYYWGDGNDNHGWVDMTTVGCDDEYYTAEIPAGYTDFKFVRLDPNKTENNWNNRWCETGNLTIPADGKNLFDMTQIYLNAQQGWTNDGARFAAYFFVKNDNSKTKWMSMSHVKDNIYKCDIPDDYNFDWVIFGRMDGNNSTNDWNNSSVWNQTSDLELTTDHVTHGNFFTITNMGSNGEKSSGSWSWNDIAWSTLDLPTITITNNNPDYGTITVTTADGTEITSGTQVDWDTEVIVSILPNSGYSVQSSSIQIGNKAATTIQQNKRYTICNNTTISVSFEEKSEYYIIGIDGDWVTFQEKYKFVDGKLLLSLEADGNKTFKIAKVKGGNLQDRYGKANTYTFKGNINTAQLESANAAEGGDHCILEPVHNGDFLFVWDENTTTLTIEYPDVCFLHGDFNGWKDKAPHALHDRDAIVYLTAGSDYEFKVAEKGIYYTAKDYTTKMTQTGDNKIMDDDTNYNTDPYHNCTVNATVTGRYIFHFDPETRILTITCPKDMTPASGDYRLIYQETDKKDHPSNIVKKRTDNGQDTVSLYIHKAGTSPQVLLQQHNGSTWTTTETYNVADMSAIQNDTHEDQGNGVWNFIIQQNNNTASVLIDASHPERYTGNYYIRTDCADGGWDEYPIPENKMTFASYSKEHCNFSHYFCKWVQDAGVNVKYTIANDYSEAITDSLTADVKTLEGTELADNEKMVTGETVPAMANIRFSWNEATNVLHRAYISGATYVSERFLVLEGDEKLKNDEGYTFTDDNQIEGLNEHETSFADLQNWIYQVDVYASKYTKVKLSAKYNNKVQYFVGAQEAVNLINSSSEKDYKIRIIYDFKTNHLIAAWLAGGNTVDEEGGETLGADLMIIRRNQSAIEQLTFTPNNNPLRTVETAYAVTTFDKTFITNSSLTPYERSLYWISFPFDVKISDVFGFGEYGEHWIMEYYDGAERAQHGLWADTDTYWKYITNKEYTLKAGTGYVLALNLSKVISSFIHDVADVSLYFPSKDYLGDIDGTLPESVTIPAHTCTITRDNRNIYDSHWNLIGVPGFADITGVNTTPNEWLADSLSFYFEYLPQTDEYRTQTTYMNNNTFRTMFSYMVQYTGTINWTTPASLSAIAARRIGTMPDKYSLRLEMAQNDELVDQTYIELHENKATADFDMNIDLTKILNNSANIYTLTANTAIMVAGNALPMEKVTVPVGVMIATAGTYTFRMPDGTDGIAVTLVDNVTGTHTNMLMSEYTITLDAGTIENRFYLVVDPDRTATSVENVGSGANGDEAKGVEKFLIDGKLFIRTTDGIFDAKGQRL